MPKEKVKITWNGKGGELDSRIVDETANSNGEITAKALCDMLKGNHLCPGDTIVITSVDEQGVF